MVRSDRGVEFHSVLMQEYVSLSGARQKLGKAWRPAEQRIVERSRQELGDRVIFRDPRAKAVGGGL
eukprot:14749663-Alexandrium_andersonii.AAC.1